MARCAWDTLRTTFRAALGRPHAQAGAGNTGSASIDSSALGNVWFNIIWTDGATGGHPGFGHGGAGDVPRTWNAAGFCGITDDDHTTSSCP